MITFLFFFFDNRSFASVDSLLSLVEEQISKDNIDSALHFADIALVQYQVEEDWSGHRRLLSRIKKLPYSTDNAKLIVAFYENVANRLEIDFERESENVWSFLGDYFARNAEFEKAVPYYEKSAAALKLLGDTTTLYIIYYRLGQALIQGFSDGVQANNYADAAIRVYKKKKRQTQRFHGKLLGLKGWAHRAIDEDKALDYYQQAIEVAGDRNGRFREQVCRILINQGRFIKAFDKANTLDDSEYGNPEKHALMAQALTGMERYDEAVKELRYAQKIYESWGYTSDPEYIKLFYFEAIAHQNNNRLLACVEKCQMVYQLTLPNYLPADAHSFPLPEDGALSLWAYNALLEHGKALRKLYSLQQDEAFLDTATNLYDRVLREIESRRWKLPNGTSKEAFNKFVYVSYDEALLAQSSFLNINHDDEAQNRFLQLYDRSKSTIFRETILSKALSKSNLSEQEQLIEDSLQSTIASLNIERAKMLGGHDLKNEADQINSRLFNYQEALKAFADKHKTTNQGRQFQSSLTKELLREAMGDDVALLAYHLTPDEIIQLFISPHDFQITTFPLTGALRQSFSLFRRGLTDWSLILDSALVSDQMINTHGTRISNALINSIKIPVEIRRLIIVPDRELHQFPFELLSYDNQNIGEKYQVSYVHTLNGILNWNNGNNHAFKYVFGGFAPSYIDDCDHNKTARRLNYSDETETVLRSSFEDLPEARANVDFIANLLNGQAWLGDEATKTRFVESMNSYKILHLGMHGQLDSSSNVLSNLVFACGPDNILHLGEIQSSDLTTELVVLSACNTGVGKLAVGEGPMSLSKSFFYAGAKSTLMSLWPVPDKQTAIIIRSFYQYLSDGLMKSHALQKAKMDYLLQASSLERHPAFWSGFVIFGDDAALQFNQGLSNFQYLLITCCVLLLFFVLYKFYQKKI